MKTYLDADPGKDYTAAECTDALLALLAGDLAHPVYQRVAPLLTQARDLAAARERARDHHELQCRYCHQPQRCGCGAFPEDCHAERPICGSCARLDALIPEPAGKGTREYANDAGVYDVRLFTLDGYTVAVRHASALNPRLVDCTCPYQGLADCRHIGRVRRYLEQRNLARRCGPSPATV